LPGDRGASRGTSIRKAEPSQGPGPGRERSQGWGWKRPKGRGPATPAVRPKPTKVYRPPPGEVWHGVETKRYPAVSRPNLDTEIAPSGASAVTQTKLVTSAVALGRVVFSL